MFETKSGTHRTETRKQARRNYRCDHCNDGPGEAKPESLLVFCQPDLSRHLLILPAGNAAEPGRLEYLEPGMGLRELRRALDLGEVKVMHHHVVAGAEFAAMSEHVIEFVPVECADHGIGFGRARGFDRVQPLQRCRVVGRLGGRRPKPVMSSRKPVGPWRGPRDSGSSTTAQRPQLPRTRP